MKRFLIVLGILAAVLVAGYFYLRYATKQASPEVTSVYEDPDVNIKLFYNRPFKKGREIFGGLVPYKQVWRTGANEASTFETNRDLDFGTGILKAGKYSIFTIPDESSWQIIFNSEHGQWGIDYKGRANRQPERDVLTVEVPSVTQEKEFEQFTMTVERLDDEYQLVLIWDRTLAAVPFVVKK